MEHAAIAALAKKNRALLEADDADEHTRALALVDKWITSAREIGKGDAPMRYTLGESAGLRVVLAFALAEALRAHAQIRKLEARPSLKYVGTWQRGRSYAPGDVVTHHGSAWHTNAATTGEPGKVAAFTLMVKRGKDR